MKMVCTRCGMITNARKEGKGSCLIEIILWVVGIPLFLLPGIIYSIWRRTDRDRICSKCGSPALVPVVSPKGQNIIEGKDQP